MIVAGYQHGISNDCPLQEKMSPFDLEFMLCTEEIIKWMFTYFKIFREIDDISDSG